MDPNLIESFSAAPILAYDYKGDLEKLFEYIQTLEYDQEVGGNCKSVDRYILKHDEFKDLNKWSLECIHDYTKKVCGSNQSILMEQSWVNVNKPGQAHAAHLHSNSFLSGVFYIASDQDKGSPIRFHNNLRNFLYSFEDTIGKGNYNPYMTSGRDVASIPGTLLVFSSQQVHSVPVNESEYNRVSIAFNTFPKLPIGCNISLNKIEKQ